jgi:hypothetical protein
LALGEAISPPIYPPPKNFGVVSEYPDPVHYGRDWRLLLPSDSATYQQAINDPISENDPQYRQVLRSIVDNIPDRD